MNDRTASCPYCGTRHFWKRQDRKELQEKGEVRIDCQCGEHYWVVMNKDGRGLHIRANRQKGVIRNDTDKRFDKENGRVFQK